MMNRRNFLVGVASVFLVAAGGCSTTGSNAKTDPYADLKKHPIEKDVDDALIRSSREIQKTLDDIAKAEQASKGTASSVRKASSWPDLPEFTKRATIARYSGDVKGLLDTVASLMGYRYEVHGKREVPVIVSFSFENKPIGHILDVIGSRIDAVADIKVDVKTKTLTLAYK